MHGNSLGEPLNGTEIRRNGLGEERIQTLNIWEKEEVKLAQISPHGAPVRGLGLYISIIQECWRRPGDRPVPNGEQVHACGATYVLAKSFRGRHHYLFGAASRKSDEERLGRRRQQRRRRLGRAFKV